jgi:NADH-quinone oxidoreductase subunit H
MDQLMNFAWKFMLPLALVNILAAGVWHYMTVDWQRWLVSGAIIVGAYLLLGRGLMRNQKLGKRIYRYAE